MLNRSNSKNKKTYDDSFVEQLPHIDKPIRIRKHTYDKNKRFMGFILSQEKKTIDSSIVKSVLPKNLLTKRYNTMKSRDFDDLELVEPIHIHDYITTHPCSYFGFNDNLKFTENTLNIDFDWKKKDLLDEWFDVKSKELKIFEPIIDLPYKTFRINSLVEYFEIVKKQYKKLKMSRESVFNDKENSKYYCINRNKNKALECFMTIRKNQSIDTDIKFDNLKKCNDVFVKLLNESLATLHKESKDNIRIVVELLGHIFDFNNILSSDKFFTVLNQVKNELSSLKKQVKDRDNKIEELDTEIKLIKNQNITLTSQNTIYKKNQNRLKTILNDFNLFYIVNKLKESRVESIRAYFQDLNSVVNEINKIQNELKQKIPPDSLNILNKATQGIQNQFDRISSMKKSFTDDGKEIIDFTFVPSRIDYKEPVSVYTQTNDSTKDIGIQTIIDISDGYAQTELMTKDKRVQVAPYTETKGVQSDIITSIPRSYRETIRDPKSSSLKESIILDDNLTPLQNLRKQTMKVKITRSFASRISFMSENNKSVNNISVYSEKIKNASFNMEAYLYNNERYKSAFYGFKRKTNHDKLTLHLYNVLKVFNENSNTGRISVNRLVDVSTFILKTILLSKTIQDPLMVIFKYFYDKSRNVNFIKKSFTCFMHSLKSKEINNCANVKMLYHMIRTDKYNMIAYNIQMLRIIYETLLP